MARRGSSAVAEPEDAVQTPEGTEEVVDETTTPDTEAAESTPAEDADEVDLSAFESAVAEALEQRDSATGDLPEASISAVQKAYRDLPTGAKVKNRAKGILQAGVKEGMDQKSLPLARANMILLDSLASAGRSTTRVEREPVDPTEAFVGRVAALALADHLVKSNVPEGVADDWTARASELVSASTEAADQYFAWLHSDSEDKGDEPEVSAVVKSAVRLAQGRSTRGARGSVSRAPYAGPKREIGKHISEAFADKQSGDFMTIAELKAFRSEEYGDSAPSPGALTARLFPQSGKCTLEDVTPGTNEQGKKGAYKN